MFMQSSKLKWMLLDCCLVSLALVLAYFLRFLPPQWVFDQQPNSTDFQYIQQILALPIYVVFRIGFFHLFNLYRGVSRFAGAHELRQIVLSVTAGTILLVAWNIGTLSIDSIHVFSGLANTQIQGFIPLSIIIVDWMACLVLLGGSRMAWRMWQLTRFNSSMAIHNILIIGAEEVGELLARHFLQNPQSGYRPIGFIDEDQKIWGRHIHGVPVFSGGLHALTQIIEKWDIEEVLVAKRKPSLRYLNQIVSMCENAHVGFKIVPAVSDLMEERMSINQIRDVEIEDLLGRESVEFTLTDDMNYLVDEVVLVTGAGGSIGSELCRQILLTRPKQLLVLGRGENSVYEISTELTFNYPDENIEVLVADIQDAERMEDVFERYRPTVVFHTAAHKHVPLMEQHPGEAIKNNVIGTFNVALLAKRYNVSRFILISSDKAVRPTSIMGASKRISEMIVSALSDDSETTFLSVRFGNVLGSRGSVVPLFRKQIASGGPVTVTDPDVERYFMTIPEAVNLVLQAGAIGSNGQLFLLEMGEPIRIADLARQMITLSGFEPNVDIDILFTGLRPGEKLTEELLTDDEDIVPTTHPKIYATRVEKPDLETAKQWLRDFSELIADSDTDGIRAKMHEIVPEFHSVEPKR